MRHGLCRKGIQDDPYLLQYWHYFRSWGVDDPRRVQFIADQLVGFHTRCWRESGLAYRREKNTASTNSTTPTITVTHPAQWHLEEVNSEAVGMLTDIYRDIAAYLAKEVVSSGHDETMHHLPQQLLDAIHKLVLAIWPADESEMARMMVIKAYERRRDEISALTVH
jgi:hypothetical protein